MPALLLLAAVIASGQSAPSPQARTERRFAEIRKSPPQLYAFLRRMPKGGDLHNHLSGAIYAETFLHAAAESHLCVDTITLRIVASPCAANQTDAAVAETENSLRNALINSLSMRDFVPTPRESAHDHFFAAFDRFGPVESSEFVAEVAQRAADQNESYLELMALSGGGSVSALGRAVGLDEQDFDVTRQKLESAGLPNLVAALKSRVDAMDLMRREKLDCQHAPTSPACLVQVNYIYQVLRESSKEQIFAQVIAGFALATLDPRVVAINFVQPEDGAISMRDYHTQMRIVDYAKQVYPQVHVALHAGELAPGLVPPEGLLFHIREAVELGHAERIGHGVDIMHERDPAGLLREMRQKDIAVEINLTSNDLILGVSGERHPFPVYRRYGVPIAISTDDEGVSRSQLTLEYQRAALNYNLSYTDLKQIVRNSLEYSFAPGDSYWTNRTYSAPVAACAGGRQAEKCKEYLRGSQKARLEADLEERFAAFERESE